MKTDNKLDKFARRRMEALRGRRGNLYMVGEKPDADCAGELEGEAEDSARDISHPPLDA